MGLPRTVLFVCPHNAAKSVLAAAYFDQARSGRLRGRSGRLDPRYRG